MNSETFLTTKQRRHLLIFGVTPFTVAQIDSPCFECLGEKSCRECAVFDTVINPAGVSLHPPKKERNYNIIATTLYVLGILAFMGAVVLFATHQDGWAGFTFIVAVGLVIAGTSY